MSKANILTRWLNSDHTPRWWVLVGSLLAFVLSLGANVLLDNRQETKSALTGTKTLSNDIVVMAQQYVAAVSNEASELESARQDLDTAIVRLHAELSTPQVKFDPSTDRSAEVLRRELRDLQSVASRVSHASELGPFWVELKEMIRARQDFFQAYENQARLL